MLALRRQIAIFIEVTMAIKTCCHIHETVTRPISVAHSILPSTNQVPFDIPPIFITALSAPFDQRDTYERLVSMSSIPPLAISLFLKSDETFMCVLFAISEDHQLECLVFV